MNPRCPRALIAVLIGVSVSIVPVRPHYGLASRHDSSRSALSQRKQQRVRVVNLRAVAVSAFRTAASEQAIAPAEGVRRPAAKVSPASAASQSARLSITRFHSRPFRC
jgi:hypothetical protein